MDKTELVTLEGMQYATDPLGQRIPEEKSLTTVYCSKKDVSRTEWFTAAQNGMKAVCCLTVWACEYHGEQTAIMNGVRYGIYRTYQSGPDDIELYLHQKVGA